MIPSFVDEVNLPPGGHECTWEELVEVFCRGPVREVLCHRLRRLLERARDCGFLKALVGGSFPTSKVDPGDLDLLWITPEGVGRDALLPECQELADGSVSRERLGCDILFLPIGHNGGKIQEWALQLGFDHKTRRDRGMILIDLTCI